jgi:hypothetical protein
MRSREPASLYSLTIAFSWALILVLSACEQTGSTPSKERGSAHEPAIASESTVQETSQAPSEDTRGPREATGIANGRPVIRSPSPSWMWAREALRSYGLTSKARSP